MVMAWNNNQQTFVSGAISKQSSIAAGLATAEQVYHQTGAANLDAELISSVFVYNGKVYPLSLCLNYIIKS